MNKKPALTVLDAMKDPTLFAAWFKGQSWDPWQAFLSALFGLPMDAGSLVSFQRHTGRQTPPESPAKEAWLVVGRRGGKSLIAALVAVFLACFRDYRRVLAPGERGVVMTIAADRRQARVVFGYITGFLEATPMLAKLVQSKTKESVELSNRITLEVHTASFRTVRGYTVVAAICDEIAYWPNENSADPDTEILNGLRPGMLTVPDSLLLCISSPYARRGALWQAWRDHYGKDRDPVLVWQSDTRSMNGTVDPKIIEAAYEQDEAAASAEYGAEFRSDVEGFVRQEVIEAAVVPGRYELPPVSSLRYHAFADPSGGSSDSFTLAIAHSEDGKAVLDCIREKKPPFSPASVTVEFSELLKSYGLREVTGDFYGGLWPTEEFQKNGITYQRSEQTKSEIYLELLPLLNSSRVELLENKRLGSQLAGLERKTSRAGKDSVDHPPSGHDDTINSAAGALVLALKGSGCGLFDWYKEQAEAIEGQQALGPSVEGPEDVVRSLSRAQKQALADGGEGRFSGPLPLEAPSFGDGGKPEWREVAPTPATSANKPPPRGLEAARIIACPRHGPSYLSREGDIARCSICKWTKHSLPAIGAGSTEAAPAQPVQVPEPPSSDSLPEKSLLPDFLTGRF